MKTIYKYKVIVDDVIEIYFPGKATILHIDKVQKSGMIILVWALVDLDTAEEAQFLHCYGIGHPLPDDIDIKNFITTVVTDPGFIWHLFRAP